jgi:protein tyrosine phosphatase (PTP) superfamily phosphohydrolase (DUF442 family)
MTALVVIGFQVRANAQTPGSDLSLQKIRAYLRIDDKIATSGLVTSEQIEQIRDAGFEVVVNLAPADVERNFLEGYDVTGAGMTYVQIPVSWQAPSLRDLEMFFDVMASNSDRKVYVHCHANMRASTFIYLFRVLKGGVPEERARVDLLRIWDPSGAEQWADFMAAAKKKYQVTGQ